MSPTGYREVDAHYTRVPIMEIDIWQGGSTITTGVLDLVDFFPTRHFRVFNPNFPAYAFGGQETTEFPTQEITPGAMNGATPEPRFVAHYFISATGVSRDVGGGSYVDLRFYTSCFGTHQIDRSHMIASIPWVGAPAIIESLSGAPTGVGEAQSGEILIAGRSLMVEATFSGVSPGGLVVFGLGVYLSPIRG